jgi:hypothetical protein
MWRRRAAIDGLTVGKEPTGTLRLLDCILLHSECASAFALPVNDLGREALLRL